VTDTIKRHIGPLAIATFGVFCICLPIALWRGLLHFDPVLKILTATVTWPAAIVIVSLVFLGRFRGAVDFFLRNVRSVQFPGGNVQVQSADNGGAANAGQVVLSAEQRDNLTNYMSELRQQHDAANASREELQRRLDATTMQMYQWKFSFLNQFFVFGTKQVLLWFAQNGLQSRTTFTQAWQPTIADANQRGVILDVLLQHGMLVTEGTAIRITPEGYGFLQFIGLIPYAPPQGAT
jgi:multidrug efflux pump subunit AcrA (membrane-fusion protein)